MIGLFASRICGSADIYDKSGKSPESSINFVTCHDGFTLNDLVSYRCKHNESNGEDNRDGTDFNFSDNCGVEGPSNNLDIEALRKRQIKNFLLTLFISRGVPMLLAGDEARRTQGGNNNAYCQNNATSWFDWATLDQHGEILAFTRGMIAFRRAHPVLSKDQFYAGEDIGWFSPQGGLPNWTDPEERQLACLILEDEQHSLCLMFNAGNNGVDFLLPPKHSEATWHIAVDTAQTVANELFVAGEEPLLEDPRVYRLGARSSAILLLRGAIRGLEKAAFKEAA
jgi:glycogen operon protein